MSKSITPFTSPADLTLTAYSYERILAEKTNPDTDRLLPYEDPTPESVGDLSKIVGTLPIQKFIFIAPPDRIDETRSKIAERLRDGQDTSLTVAIAGMLEASPCARHYVLANAGCVKQPCISPCGI